MQKEAKKLNRKEKNENEDSIVSVKNFRTIIIHIYVLIQKLQI